MPNIVQCGRQLCVMESVEAIRSRIVVWEIDLHVAARMRQSEYLSLIKIEDV